MLGRALRPLSSVGLRRASIAKFFEKAVTHEWTQPAGRPYIPYGTFDERGNKVSTNLVGLAVRPNAIKELEEQAELILNAVTLGIPPAAQYRINVERIYGYRLKCARELKTVLEIELAVRCGQIEELLKQGEGELHLIPEMRKWKPWEASAEEAREHFAAAEGVRQRLHTAACDFTEIHLGKPAQATTFDGAVATTQAK